jgi:hypothetical protein
MPDENSVVLMQQVEQTPEPPRPLLKYGQDLWDRIWGMGATWVSDRTDLELLTMTCEMVDERWNLRVKVMQSDDAAMRRGLRELDRQIVSNLSLLGFTPSDRSRLGVAEVKAKSKLEELMERRANRGVNGSE